MIQQADRFKAEVSKPSMAKGQAREALKQLDEDEAKDFGWESNRKEENPENLPWPEENESKE